MSRFLIRGARGSMVEAGPHVIKYGGHTICFTLETESGMIILDAGTGLQLVDRDLAHRKHLPPLAVLFTHFHLDHLIGLPFFDALYNPNTELAFWADGSRPEDWRDNLANLMRRPYWPVELYECPATCTFHDLPEPGPLRLFDTEISWLQVPHPQGCVAYRLQTQAASYVVATDAEYADADEAKPLIELARGADHLLFDAHFVPEEYPLFKGWGHSTWATATEIARRAEVGRLILIHHAHGRSDGQLDKILAQARETFPRTDAAVEGMELGPDGSIG